MTLLHYMVDLANNENPSLLDWAVDLTEVKAASKFYLDALTGEIREWSEQIQKLQVQLATANDQQLDQLTNQFLDSAKDKLASLQRLVDEIDRASLKLAQHFSVDLAKMKISEVFTIFSDLADKIAKAAGENEQRKKVEERTARLAAQKQAQKESQQQAQDSVTDGNNGINSSTEKKSGRRNIVPQEEVRVVDRLLADIRRGDFKLRKSAS